MKAADHLKSENQIPTRQSLIERLRDWDDSRSWMEFFNTYWRLIYNVAIKSGLTDDEAQEVVQETIIGVSQNVHKFHFSPKPGSFKGWLLTRTRWRICDQLRKRQAAAPSPALDSGPLSPMEAGLPDPAGDQLDLVWEKEWQQAVFGAALDRVKKRVDPKNFQVFCFYVLKEMPVDKVARLFGVNIGHVYLIKSRISSMIKKEVKILEKEMS